MPVMLHSGTPLKSSLFMILFMNVRTLFLVVFVYRICSHQVTPNLIFLLHFSILFQFLPMSQLYFNLSYLEPFPHIITFLQQQKILITKG